MRSATGGSKGTSKVTFPSSATKETKFPRASTALAPIDVVVADLCAQMDGKVAYLMDESASAMREFVAHGGVDRMAVLGWRVTRHPGFGYGREYVYIESMHEPEPGDGPRERFLQAYEVTGDRADYVPAAFVRGHWLAEHCSLPMDKRGEGAKLLVTLGAKRGRVRGIRGGVLRGVRQVQP